MAEERIAIVASITHQLAERVYFHTTHQQTVMHEMTDEDLFSRLDDLAKGAPPIGKPLFEVENRKLETSDDIVIESLFNHCTSKSISNAQV
jgi:hypothetical protein